MQEVISRRFSRAAVPLVLIGLLFPAQSPADAGSSGLLDPGWIHIPVGYSSVQAEHLRQAVQLEATGDAEAAEALYQSLMRTAPDVSAAYGHGARALFTLAERTDAAENELRIQILERAMEWAGRGLEVDPECATCMLYRAAALGRLSVIHGPLWGGRHVSELMGLLTRGIELEPDERDGPESSTLGNLYFARAIVYRTVPEWFWLRWVIGLRGDIDAALVDIAKARALHPSRLDMQVEHAVILICHALRRDTPEHRHRGLALLRRAANAPAKTAIELKDQVMARALLNAPDRACEFSRDGFLDFEEHRDGFR